jgi:hypothetical protein
LFSTTYIKPAERCDRFCSEVIYAPALSPKRRHKKELGKKGSFSMYLGIQWGNEKGGWKKDNSSWWLVWGSLATMEVIKGF